MIMNAKAPLGPIEREPVEEGLEALLDKSPSNMAAAHSTGSEALHIHVLVHPIGDAELIGYRKVFLHEESGIHGKSIHGELARGIGPEKRSSSAAPERRLREEKLIRVMRALLPEPQERHLGI